MKQRFWLAAVVAVMSVGLVFCGVGQVMAKATGQCSDCHTMHDSQNNASVATSGPNSKLLTKATCIACHTGSNDGTNNIPYVYSTSAVYSDTGTEGTSNTLAGGNFYWMTTDDTMGHNVTDLDADGDTQLGVPPGFNNAFNLNGQISGGTWTDGTDLLTCAGTNGCHGRHHDGTSEITDAFVAVAGGHHGEDATIDGSTVAQSYRFLFGIVGKEDGDWEYQPDASNHNQYKGIDRTSDTIADFDKSTISYLCAECHGDFHSGTGTLGASATDTSATSPWIRHPTDFDLENASSAEYDAYNGGTGLNNSYSVIAPVASADVTSVLSTVTPAGGTADDTIVTCISCHRAHGTPYADLLRWDPLTAEAGTTDTGGCLICHTTK